MNISDGEDVLSFFTHLKLKAAVDKFIMSSAVAWFEEEKKTSSHLV